VAVAKFSPDGEFVAVGVGRLVQVWRTPGFEKQMSPMQLHRTYGQCHADVLDLDWSPDSKFIAVASKDIVARLGWGAQEGEREDSEMGRGEAREMREEVGVVPSLSSTRILVPSLPFYPALSLSLSLSLTHTHTHTHTPSPSLPPSLPHSYSPFLAGQGLFPQPPPEL
jgi:hypothetical protein